MNFSSVTGKNWIFKKFKDDDIKKYSEEYSLKEVVAKLLAIRKNNIQNIEFFLNPTIKNLLPNPFQLKDMERAVERTYKSLLNNELIGIFGDYDVDGASSTALLVKYFSSINRKIKTYIPDRKKEGYGPSVKGFNNLISSGSKIIFTVDCGTSAYEPIQEAKKQNIDVIVLDHHQSDVKLPVACAIVNPNRLDDTSQLNYLCAAGVCFMFLVGLNKKLRDMNWFVNNNVNEPNILNLLDLVSLGTVCDVVPLIGLNRALVKQGLKIIKQRSNMGLKTLYDLCKIGSQPTTYELGYMLGPRINAGGRVGKASHGVELLISNDAHKAYKLASDLEKYNNERKSIEFILTEEINIEVKKFHNHPVLVLAGKNWHEGIIGIVASRIKEKYNKPTVLISLNNDEGKGSARSVFGFDIGAQIIKAVHLGIVRKGGGHKMAGGFSIDEKKIDTFRDFLIKNYENSKIDFSNIFNLLVDSVIAPSAINEEFYEDVYNLAPFGVGNGEPKFVIENLKVIKSNLISDKHIKSILSGKDGSVIKSIAWNAKNSPLENVLSKNNKKFFNIAGKMKLNEWNGKRNVEFIIEDASLN
tara:strand:+ start:348 stop:2096 length:1749 start_codon:yes stop_codon:yes gene_type:complete